MYSGCQDCLCTENWRELANSEPYQKAVFLNDFAPADRQHRYMYMCINCNCHLSSRSIAATGVAARGHFGGYGEQQKNL